MSIIPKFLLYGQSDSQIKIEIQPVLELRRWTDLTQLEKETALREIMKNGWLGDYSMETRLAIEQLNYFFLRICPGKELHKIQASRRADRDTHFEQLAAANKDFQNIFLHSESEPMVFRMLTCLANYYITNAEYYEQAEQEQDETERDKIISEAFEKFDRLAACLNHIFEQFAVNALLTRMGLVPRQDEKIMKQIYEPTLRILSSPKWKGVNSDLVQMFEYYRTEKYSETITLAHTAVQRFLQQLVGEEGKNGKGEVGKLFSKAKADGKIPINKFTEPIINVFQGFISSERATNSTAKPTLKIASSSDALLVMNVVIIFFQYCLQSAK